MGYRGSQKEIREQETQSRCGVVYAPPYKLGGMMEYGEWSTLATCSRDIVRLIAKRYGMESFTERRL